MQRRCPWRRRQKEKAEALKKLVLDEKVGCFFHIMVCLRGVSILLLCIPFLLFLGCSFLHFLDFGCATLGLHEAEARAAGALKQELHCPLALPSPHFLPLFSLNKAAPKPKRPECLCLLKGSALLFSFYLLFHLIMSLGLFFLSLSLSLFLDGAHWIPLQSLSRKKVASLIMPA